MSRQNFEEWISDSKVIDARGRPKKVFHGTDKDFRNFCISKSSDIGVHFGTKGAAVKRGRLKEGASLDSWRVIPAYLSIKNPIEMPDLEDWHPDQISYRLRVSGIITEAEEDAYNQQFKNDWTGAYEALRQIMSERGFDGIVYKNDVEGGTSFIAIHESSIKNLDEEEEVEVVRERMAG